MHHVRRRYLSFGVADFTAERRNVKWSFKIVSRSRILLSTCSAAGAYSMTPDAFSKRTLMP